MDFFISFGSLMELIKHVNFLIDKWQEYQRQRKISAARFGRNDERLAEILSLLYPDTVYPNDDPRYAIALFPIHSEQQVMPDSILGNLSITPVEIDENIRKAGEKYVNFLKNLGRPLEDLPVYCLDRLWIESNVSFKMDCRMGTYFDSLKTCDVLEWELLTTLGVSPDSSVETLVEQLKLRGYIHYLSRGADPLMNPIGRSAAIAVSTAIVFRRDDDYGVILAKRSSQGVAIHGDLYHVAPSGMFQPAMKQSPRSAERSQDPEFSIMHNVYREYLEELFGHEKTKKPPTTLAHNFFYKNANLKFLFELLKKGEAQFLLTGISVNLLNLRPEICTLIWINTPEWYEKHKAGENGLKRIELNEEFSRGYFGAVTFSPEMIAKIQQEELVPPAAAALFLALQTAKLRGWV